MRIFNKQIVDVGHLQGLEAANSRLQTVVEHNNMIIDAWKQRAQVQLDDNIELSNRIIELEQTIADNKFLPNNKPNLELAAKTVADWGNNRTIVSFFKKLFMLVDDSVIETIVRYANTEVKKRKLNLEVK